MTSTSTQKSRFSVAHAAIYFGGLVMITLVTWFFLEIYPIVVALAFNAAAYLGVLGLLGWIGWRLWKGKETKVTAALKSAGLVFLAFPVLSGVALFALAYLPTPSEDVVLRLVNLSPAERVIEDLECERSGAEGFGRNRVTCSFTVYVKGDVTSKGYQGSVDLQYNRGSNRWTRYERQRR